jgi:hypothetical protein
MAEEFVGIKILEDSSEIGYDSPSHNVILLLNGASLTAGTKDGTFTTYTKVHDVVVDGAGMTNPINVTAASIDETNGWVTFIENGTGNDRLVTCKFDGTSKSTLYSGGSPYNLGLGPNVCQSAGGTIQVWADGNDNYYVSSKGALIHTINTSGILASDVGLAISITGKYVFIVGDNGSQEARFQIWQGS